MQTSVSQLAFRTLDWSQKYCHLRKLFTNELVDSRTIDYNYVFTEHWISNMTYTTGNTAPYAIHDMSVM